MSDFTKEQLDAIWLKGDVVAGLEKSEYRLDAAGALMARSKYGEKELMFGWEVDHVFPKIKLEKRGIKKELWDDLRNLRPMNVKNNASKGDDYPTYKAVYKYNAQIARNEEVDNMKDVNDGVRAELNNLFGLNKAQSKT